MSEWVICSKKRSDSLIRSFLMSNLSNSLMITLFVWATWANCSWSLIFGERPKGFAHIAHFWWATWAIHSRSLICLEWSERSANICSYDLSKMSEWANERWANEQWANERWANEQIPSPVYIMHYAGLWSRAKKSCRANYLSCLKNVFDKKEYDIIILDLLILKSFNGNTTSVV